MPSRLFAPLFAAALSWGRTARDDAETPADNLDVRIDMASDASDPDSKDAQMCVDDAGSIYVV